MKAGASNGDSGGPAFVILPDGSRRLFGVTSGKGEVGAWYGILRTSLCWMAHDAKISVPDADLHCYDQFDGAIADKSRALLAVDKHSNLPSQLPVYHAVAFDLRTIDHPEEISSLALPDTVEANWSELNRFTKLSELDLHFERLDLNAVKMLVTLPLTLGSTHPEMDIRWAITKKNLAIFKRVLPQILDVNAVKLPMRSLLVEAAWMEESEMVRLLIERGANVDSQEGERRYTALHYAVMLRNLDSAKYLVAAHASCLLKDFSGATVLDGIQSLPKSSPLRVLIEAHCTK